MTMSHEPTWLMRLQEHWPILSGIFVVGWSIIAWFRGLIRKLNRLDRAVPEMEKGEALITTRTLAECQSTVLEKFDKDMGQHKEDFRRSQQQVLEAIKGVHARLDRHIDKVNGES